MSDEQTPELIEILLVVKLPVRSSVLVGLVGMLTKQFGKKVFMRQQGLWMEFFKKIDEQ